ncbi:MAG: energy transducer TonB [Acidobacteriota bacterium]|nr:energy transducer TonB [Acidobacteriota bacterium]
MKLHTPEKIPFSMLPARRAPWREFGFSALTHGAFLLALIAYGTFGPSVVRHDSRDYRFVSVVAPTPEIEKPKPMVQAMPPEIVRSEPPQAPAIHIAPQKKIVVRQPDTPVTPKIEMAAREIPLQPDTPVIPKQLIKTNVFSTGSSAPKTAALPPEKVQTGGFGDPNGVPAHGESGKAANIAELGSYDLPQGSGKGNGTAGQHGVAAVVASAGFGSGVAPVDRTGGPAARGAVRAGGFGDAEAAAAPQPHTNAASTATVFAAEILSKPTPVYTEEARKLRIEGEVLLEVVFEGSGRLRVVRLVRGLGHGLDEAAEQAAKDIRFKPAVRDGRPADSMGVLHIRFQLT